MGDERRRYFRLPSRVVAMVRIPGSGKPPVYTRTASVALGGCGLRADCGFEPGQEVQIDFEGEYGVVTVQGCIAYSEPLPRGIYKIGVEFVDVSPDQRQALSHLIEHDSAIG